LRKRSRGKSGQQRQRWSLTATGGNPRESATETKLPLASFGVKGKGETSEVRAHSLPWRHGREVNPAGCKEILRIEWSAPLGR